MKKHILGAAFVGALFAVSVLASGIVTDKAAHGVAGDKQYTILIDYRHVGAGEVWIPVSEEVWDRCPLGGRFLRCGG